MTQPPSPLTMLFSRHTRRREFITLLGGALSAFHCVSASAQEGYYGAGHDKWHQGTQVELSYLRACFSENPMRSLTAAAAGVPLVGLWTRKRLPSFRTLTTSSS